MTSLFELHLRNGVVPFDEMIFWIWPINLDNSFTHNQDEKFVRTHDESFSFWVSLKPLHICNRANEIAQIRLVGL